MIANAQEGNKILYLEGGKHGKVANGRKLDYGEHEILACTTCSIGTVTTLESKEKKNNLVKVQLPYELKAKSISIYQ